MDEYVAWKDGMYVFDQTPLGDILQTLSRWYDFQMFYQNASIKETSFSGELMRFESFEDILDIISKASDVQFSINGRTVIASER